MGGPPSVPWKTARMIGRIGGQCNARGKIFCLARVRAAQSGERSGEEQTMSEVLSDIRIERQAPKARLAALGVENWPIWTKEASTFPWTYDAAETCYFLEGEVVVTPDGGAPVAMGAGDLVTFPAGLSCTWAIRRAVRKHYKFG
jgi:uncharacterized protein